MSTLKNGGWEITFPLGRPIFKGYSILVLGRADNGDIALVVQDIDEKGKQLETEDAGVTSSNRRVAVLAMAWYVLMTLLYFVYRSQEKSIFTPEAFQLRWHDLVGLLFLLSFLLLRKPSYLVYAINPFRNVVLVAFQLFFPRLRDPETNPEYYRNILSASIQLCTATAIWWCTTPQPIGSGTCWKAEAGGGKRHSVLTLQKCSDGMAFWAFQHFLLALWPNLYASCSDEQCDHTAWLQVHASEPEEWAELPKALQELADCDKEDLGCGARKTACSLATKLSHDWPQSYSGISEILGQLQDVCNGKPLALTSDTSGEALEVEDDDDDEEMNISHVSLLSQLPNTCKSRPGECTTNVVEYEKKNPGAKYGMNTGKAVAKASVDTLKEILKDAKLIALEGLTAFAFIGSFISAFFPSAGGLPVNPCTFVTQDWGPLCVGTGRAIKTTAGAYLSQFASLHISVMTNILGSLKYRTEGDRYVFQTVSGCYALRVYDFATAALQSRMAALQRHEEDDGVTQCCPMYGHCSDCPLVKVSYEDNWKLECGWKDPGWSRYCAGQIGVCVTSLRPPYHSDWCYYKHSNETEKQTVSFWLKSCLKKWLKRFVNLLLVTTGVAAVAIALEKQTDHFRTLHTEDHGWKIIFSVLLGMAEEVTWRTVYMADNNNSIQALTWGINHIVAGTGMKNPWLYGLVSGSYAFCLGVTPYDPTYSQTYASSPERTAKTDSDQDGIGSEDAGKPIPASPDQRRDWTHEGDHVIPGSPTDGAVSKYGYKQVGCENMTLVAHCGRSDESKCIGSYQIHSGVGYTCTWDLTIWPPACISYRNKPATPVCFKGTCGQGSPAAPDRCW
eukprot:symbB.v1.2.002791.t1/scaffold150.1/size295742/10